MLERHISPSNSESSRPNPLILTEQDQDLLAVILPPTALTQIERAEQGELPCPMCDNPLDWLVMIAEEYEGLTLVCCGCGFCEY